MIAFLATRFQAAFPTCEKNSNAILRKSPYLSFRSRSTPTDRQGRPENWGWRRAFPIVLTRGCSLLKIRPSSPFFPSTPPSFVDMAPEPSEPRQVQREPYLPTFEEVMQTYEYEDSMRLPSYQGRPLGRFHPYRRLSPYRLVGEPLLSRLLVCPNVFNYNYHADNHPHQNTIYDEEGIFLGAIPPVCPHPESSLVNAPADKIVHLLAPCSCCPDCCS